MKSIPQIFICAFAMLQLASTAQADTVAASGDWNSTTTWSSGTVPTTSSESPMASLDFAADNLTLNVSSEQYVKYINGANNTNSTINIAAGTTFINSVGTISTSDTTRTIAITNSADNIVHYTGDGTLQLGVSGVAESFFRKGNYIFDTVVSSKISAGFLNDSAKAGSATYNKNYTSTGQMSIGNGWTLTFSEGAYVKLSSAFTFWGSSANSMLYVKKGATIESNSNATMISKGIIDGNIIAKGNQNWRSNKYALKLGSVTFNSTSSLTQTRVSNYKAIITGELVSNADVGKLVIGSDVYFNNNSSITFNTKDAFRLGGAASQAASNMYIAGQAFDISGTTYTEKLVASTATLNFNADNALNMIYFFDGSKLKINNNSHALTLGGFGLIDTSTAFNVELYGLTDFTVKINSLDNITTNTDNGIIRAENVWVADAEGTLDFAYIQKDETNGGWWINATNTVPEPSTVAAIFGTLALGLAVYRKR